MKNSLCEIDKNKYPEAYNELFGGEGTQVYIDEEQVFDVVKAATYSDKDKLYNPGWIDYVKFKDGSIKHGSHLNIKIVVRGKTVTSVVCAFKITP